MYMNYSFLVLGPHPLVLKVTPGSTLSDHHFWQCLGDHMGCWYQISGGHMQDKQTTHYTIALFSHIRYSWGYTTCDTKISLNRIFIKSYQVPFLNTMEKLEINHQKKNEGAQEIVHWIGHLLCTRLTPVLSTSSSIVL